MMTLGNWLRDQSKYLRYLRHIKKDYAFSQSRPTANSLQKRNHCCNALHPFSDSANKTNQSNLPPDENQICLGKRDLKDRRKDARRHTLNNGLDYNMVSLFERHHLYGVLEFK